MNWFLNNREVIRNLAINTGTSASPTFTPFCTISEVALAMDFEEKDFYVFCDAIKRSIVTGAKLTINAVVKIDMNNAGIIAMLGDLHSLLENGTIAQFNNVLVQFELIESVTANVLTYKKYQVPVVMKISEIGGGAEGEGEYSLELVINGKGSVITA